jgi:type IV fimbrial biogenesis protein FimT
MDISAKTMDRTRQPGAPADGFTLVEVMITLSVAAVLMAIGVPMFRDTIARNRLTEQANDLVAAITIARSQAITANQRITLCRVDSDADDACSGTAGSWEFWVVNNAAGTVLRRGTVPTYGGVIEVTSELTNDEITFASDGLARTNGALVAGEQILVCSSHGTTDNQRTIALGAGSRVSTNRASGAC